MYKCPVCQRDLVDGECETFECWEKRYCKTLEIPHFDPIPIDNFEENTQIFA